MKFDDLLDLVGNEPVFETGLLLSGAVESNEIRGQVSRWVQGGRLIQLRRGLYALAPPYRRAQIHPFLIANRIAPGSYVSLQAALAHFGLIPEQVAVVTSVGNVRPRQWQTPLGDFAVRHIKPDLLWGYELTSVNPPQQAFLALPEKALLDLIYLHPHADDPNYLRQLRLQNLERLNQERLRTFADRSDSAKIRRALLTISKLITTEAEAYTPL